MWFKVIVLFVMAAIVFNLGSALYYLLRKKESGTRMAKALSWRIGLSLSLFCLLFIAFAAGWIKPHGI